MRVKVGPHDGSPRLRSSERRLHRRPGHHQQGRSGRPREPGAVAVLFGRLHGSAPQPAHADHAGQRGAAGGPVDVPDRRTGNKFEATPIVIDGMMYITGALNHAWAIDARTGTQIWHYQRSAAATGLKVCCGLVNRGFAVYGDRLFMVTLDAHLVALDMKTGKVVWDIEMAKRQGWLRRHRRAAGRQGQGDRRHRRRRVRESRLYRRLRAGDRQARLALLHRPGAGRAGQRDVVGDIWAARRRADVADRHLRSGAEPALLGHRQSQPGLGRRRADRATTCTPARWSRSTPTPAS